MTFLADSKPSVFCNLTSMNYWRKSMPPTSRLPLPAMAKPSPESYQSLQNAISRLKLIAHAEEDVRLGRTITQKELETEMLEVLAGPDKESDLFGIWSGRDNINNVEGYVRSLRFNGGAK